MNCVWSATRLSCFMNKGFAMSLNEDQTSLQSARQRALLDQRAAALRANLKRRKDQTSERKDSQPSDTQQEITTLAQEGTAL